MCGQGFYGGERDGVRDTGGVAFSSFIRKSVRKLIGNIELMNMPVSTEGTLQHTCQ